MNEKKAGAFDGGKQQNKRGKHARSIILEKEMS